MKNSIRRIELAMFRLHPEVKPLYTALKRISNGDVLFIPTESPAKVKVKQVYGKQLSAKPHILEAVSTAGRFINLKVIRKAVAKVNKGFDGNLSYLLNRLKNEGLLVNFTPTGSKKNYYWGLPTWIDSSGYPKLEHSYSKTTVRKGGLFE